MPPSSHCIAMVSDPLGTQAGYGGAEKLFETVWQVLSAQGLTLTAHTPLVNEAVMQDVTLLKALKTGPLNDFALLKRHVQFAYPLLPWLTEQQNVQHADTVLSFHHVAAKAVLPAPGARHLCYCHTPARYLYDQYWPYLQQSDWLTRQALQLLAPPLRQWDTTTATRVDTFLANSRFTARRIERYWGRQATVLHPPIDCQRFSFDTTDEFWLTAGRLVPYKRFDFVIDLFNRLRLPLMIIGDGPERQKLEAMAGDTITFLGHVDTTAYETFMGRCIGFVYPALEDFGMAVAEAQASGKPVLAQNAGGSCDIVTHGSTGLLLDDMTLTAWMEGVRQIERQRWDHAAIAASAQRFDTSQFAAQLLQHLTINRNINREMSPASHPVTPRTPVRIDSGSGS
ncbi:MAG: glycosyltransferase [Cyanobacteria bacterium HKST-UBA03]|nr:glycosyltransferase [Cyanobacteria bacterium HKST-UBA03]